MVRFGWCARGISSRRGQCVECAVQHSRAVVSCVRMRVLGMRLVCTKSVVCYQRWQSSRWWQAVQGRSDRGACLCAGLRCIGRAYVLVVGLGGVRIRTQPEWFGGTAVRVRDHTTDLHMSVPLMCNPTDEA
jgi:hypothetical protein